MCGSIGVACRSHTLQCERPGPPWEGRGQGQPQPLPGGAVVPSLAAVLAGSVQEGIQGGPEVFTDLLLWGEAPHQPPVRVT